MSLSLCMETQDYESMPLNQENSAFFRVPKDGFYFCNFSQSALSSVQKRPVRDWEKELKICSPSSSCQTALRCCLCWLLRGPASPPPPLFPQKDPGTDLLPGACLQESSLSSLAKKPLFWLYSCAQPPGEEWIGISVLLNVHRTD